MLQETSCIKLCGEEGGDPAEDALHALPWTARLQNATAMQHAPITTPLGPGEKSDALTNLQLLCGHFERQALEPGTLACHTACRSSDWLQASWQSQSQQASGSHPRPSAGSLVSDRCRAHFCGIPFLKMH